MRVIVPCLVLFTPLLGCPGETDETGCPFELTEAIGSPCSNEGQQCGEASLCDECTSDPSACELIECSDGAWVEVPISELCDG